MVFTIKTKKFLGLVLCFTYLKGSKKQKSYSLDSAPVHFQTDLGTKPRGIGVMATWYSWDDEGKLTKNDDIASYIKIENYKCTMRQSPLFESGILILNQNQLEEIKGLKLGNFYLLCPLYRQINILKFFLFKFRSINSELFIRHR